ncbi:methylmalonyl Co-A mutase-associated GTPase MeaB [Peribacillus deserti]|uniref:Methylmalonyl Co-A mutase-associated GTPase MeaB n=1 Tax=Peribacillus deserti TaxID=673318 RepID=A0A2N5M0H6_9BACI|nr:methylmalonyl Co-A mutase-associated GTPase MeaB [Peribacillus deserti]PLT27860.1 methylmalonyl Co-A mutase-associated GTPase MeaB [Peribacillus deserti]
MKSDDQANLAGNGNPRRKFFKKNTAADPDIDDLYKGILEGDRAKLAKAITLIESNASRHFESAQKLLEKLQSERTDSIRIGISGVPGAGKSTFIEAFGTYLCNTGYRVAVLAVDPSSTLSGGSILGDKTRMEELARNPNAFIRPSPTGGTLGGVHRKTRESITICEAAGFDVILVETVGVGQSEAMVREMVDFFLLLVLTGAGDELQGMKKGIMELADAVLVNKADGSNIPFAEKTRAEYNRILHFIQPATTGWETRAYTCSALTLKGIEEFWHVIKRFREACGASGILQERRNNQLKDWMSSLISEQLTNLFYQNRAIQNLLPAVQKEVTAGIKPAAKAVQELFHYFRDAMKD